MILRHAEKTDLPVLEELFKDWILLKPSIQDTFQHIGERGSEGSTECRVLESERHVRIALLSVPDGPGRRRIAAIGGVQPREDPWVKRFLEEQIMDWAQEGVAKVSLTLPLAMGGDLVFALHACGFFAEGVSTSFQSQRDIQVHLCKHFLYRTISEQDFIGLMTDVFTGLGYEMREEKHELGFRLAQPYLPPFLFSPWHKISLWGTDFVVQPPVRKIQFHEIETAFYPLSIQAKDEKPLLLMMDAKRAPELIDLPQSDLDQGSLFPGAVVCRSRTMHLSDITCAHPSAAQLLRKGLPLLFYVNRIGAVGSGRLEDWDVDEPDRLCEKFHHTEGWEAAEVAAHAAASGPLAGRMLAVRFHWFRPFQRAVSFEQIRALDESFLPQRTRTVSPHLFRAVVDAGNAHEDGP
jgi:hypothetical protein